MLCYSKLTSLLLPVIILLVVAEIIVIYTMLHVRQKKMSEPQGNISRHNIERFNFLHSMDPIPPQYLTNPVQLQPPLLQVSLPPPTPAASPPPTVPPLSSAAPPSYWEAVDMETDQ